MGQQLGINFSFAGKIGNTRDAHRLIALAGGGSGGHQADTQDRVVMELFRDYFEGEGDVTSHETLARVGEKAGLDGDDVRRRLAGGEGGDQVDAEVREARARGVTGVPSFKVQGRYVVEGAQDEQAFMEVFVKVKEGEEAAAEQVEDKPEEGSGVTASDQYCRPTDDL